MMAGVILETLSNKKLIGFAVVLFLVQTGFFLIGGLIAPSPHNVQNLISNICVDTDKVVNISKWLYPRPLNNEDKQSCKVAKSLDELTDKKIGDERNVIFAFQLPLPREGILHLPMSKVQQYMIAIVDVKIEYMGQDPSGFERNITMDARLGGRNLHETEWTEIARSLVDRPLKCDPPHKNETGYHFECDALPLFEISGIEYEQYLINIRLPAPFNEDIGKLKEFGLHIIHPNGGFTYVWLSVKTLVFPLVLIALVWFVYRLTRLQRPPNVLEQTLVALGIAMTILNIPVDWFTLWLHMPFMLLYSDIRQGLFYSVLLCFWIIFVGEHMMDQLDRNHVSYYWKHLLAVGFGCICLFAFEMCERGVQLTNPFYSIWASTKGQYLGLTFIILAGLAAGVYFIYLLVMLVKVFRNILAKKSALPAMSKPRRKFYMGLIYRFCFLMAFTLLCAALTVAMFILGQVSEGHWKWGHQKLEYTSAVQTGVYGMWNIYVFALLILYAPSAKYVPLMSTGDESTNDEQVEFSTIPSEASVLTSFVQKASAD